MVALGCTLDAVRSNDLKQAVAALTTAGKDLAPEMTCVQLSTRYIPLCPQDVRNAEPRTPLAALYEKLGLVVHRSSSRPLSKSTNSTVRRLLQWAGSALDACTRLLRHLDAHGFKEGALDSDRSVREALDVLVGVISELRDEPYSAVPLLVMAAVVEGGLAGTLAAMLQGKDLAEMARRGAMFYTALQLVRLASGFPDLAQLLATPVWLAGRQASVLGCLAALSEAGRVLLDWERDSGAGGAAVGRELQRKMARRVQEAHALLASKVAALEDRSVAAASAPRSPPGEVHQLDSLIGELRVDGGRASGHSTANGRTGAEPAAAAQAGSCSNGAYEYNVSYSGSAAEAASSSYSPAYGGRYGEYGQQQQQQQYGWLGNPGPPGSGVPGASYSPATPRGGNYTQYYTGQGAGRVSGGGSGTSSAVHSARSDGGLNGSPGSAAAESMYGVSQSYGSTSPAVRDAVEALRIQRELMRLQQAAAAATAPVTGTAAGAGGRGTYGYGGSGTAPAGRLVRDGQGHHSQSEHLAPFRDITTTSTLTYPWQVSNGQQQQQQKQQAQYTSGGGSLQSQKFSAPGTPQPTSLPSHDAFATQQQAQYYSSTAHYGKQGLYGASDTQSGARRVSLNGAGASAGTTASAGQPSSAQATAHGGPYSYDDGRTGSRLRAVDAQGLTEQNQLQHSQGAARGPDGYSSGSQRAQQAWTAQPSQYHPPGTSSARRSSTGGPASSTSPSPSLSPSPSPRDGQNGTAPRTTPRSLRATYMELYARESSSPSDQHQQPHHYQHQEHGKTSTGARGVAGATGERSSWQYVELEAEPVGRYGTSAGEVGGSRPAAGRLSSSGGRVAWAQEEQQRPPASGVGVEGATGPGGRATAAGGGVGEAAAGERVRLQVATDGWAGESGRTQRDDRQANAGAGATSPSSTASYVDLYVSGTSTAGTYTTVATAKAQPAAKAATAAAPQKHQQHQKHQQQATSPTSPRIPAHRVRAHRLSTVATSDSDSSGSDSSGSGGGVGWSRRNGPAAAAAATARPAAAASASSAKVQSQGADGRTGFGAEREELRQQQQQSHGGKDSGAWEYSLYPDTRAQPPLTQQQQRRQQEQERQQQAAVKHAVADYALYPSSAGPRSPTSYPQSRQQQQYAAVQQQRAVPSDANSVLSRQAGSNVPTTGSNTTQRTNPSTASLTSTVLPTAALPALPSDPASSARHPPTAGTRPASVQQLQQLHSSAGQSPGSPRARMGTDGGASGGGSGMGSSTAAPTAAVQGFQGGHVASGTSTYLPMSGVHRSELTEAQRLESVNGLSAAGSRMEGMSSSALQAAAAMPLPGPTHAQESGSRFGWPAQQEQQQQQQQLGAHGYSSTAVEEEEVVAGLCELVGPRMPLTALHQRYADANPLLCAKLVSLEDDFPATRRVGGDGNCFYRAALFALLEAVLTAPDPGLGDRLERTFAEHLRRLEPPTRDAAATASRSPSPSPLTPRGRADASGGQGSPRGRSPSPSPAAARATEDGPLPPVKDPQAYRGGQLLLRLLKLAWYKSPDTDTPSDVSSLEALLNDPRDSAATIRFARSLTCRELMAAEDFYSPFINGCGRDYDGLTLRQICARYVMPLGEEVEQLQIIALCAALGVTVAVLDVAGSQVGAIKHGPQGAHPAPPCAWVAHLPGHYDVVYPARRMDVAPGGALVPL